nr:hypothetical protein [Tanacetum cinerariifolium]
MLLCKQAEKGVPLQAEQYDWLADADEDIDGNICLVETDDSNVIPDAPDVCDDDIQNDQNDVERDDEQTSKTLGESNSVRDRCLVVLQNKQNEFKKYKAFNDRTIDYDKLERQLNETLGQLAQKDIEIKEGMTLLSSVSTKHVLLMDSDCSECCSSLVNTLYPVSFCTYSNGSESVHESAV